jgi:hypothetical protein
MPSTTLKKKFAKTIVIKVGLHETSVWREDVEVINIVFNFSIERFRLR